MHTSTASRAALFLMGLGFCLSTAMAQEATIRKNLPQRLPTLPPIDSVTPTPMKGLFEVRVNGTELLYSDANGDFVLLQGELFDTRQRVNLTEARMNQLTAIAFKDLPLKDAVVTVRGNGSRKIAVFSDPNCGFCKRLERDLLKLNDVTVYTFVVAMLGPDSQTKARNIWCAAKPAEAYNDWMIDHEVAQVVAGVVFAQATQAMPNLAVGAHHLQTQTQVARVAVAQHLRAARVGGQVAANRATALRGQAQGEQKASLSGHVLHGLQNTTSLHREGAVGGVEFAHAVQARGAQHDLLARAIGHRAHHQAGVAALGHQARAVRSTGLHDRGHLGDALRLNDSQGATVGAAAPIALPAAEVGAGVFVGQHVGRAHGLPQCVEQHGRVHGCFGETGSAAAPVSRACSAASARTASKPAAFRRMRTCKALTVNSTIHKRV